MILTSCNPSILNHEVVFEFYARQGLSPDLELSIATILKSSSDIKTPRDVINAINSAMSMFIRELTREIELSKLEDALEESLSTLEDKELSSQKRDAVFEIMDSAEVGEIDKVFNLVRALLSTIVDKPTAKAALDSVSGQSKEISGLLQRRYDRSYLPSEQREAIQQILASVKYIDTSNDVYNLVRSIMSVLVLGNREDAAGKRLEKRLSSLLPKGFFRNRSMPDERVKQVEKIIRLTASQQNSKTGKLVGAKNETK